jgi:hypothetical protein
VGYWRRGARSDTRERPGPWLVMALYSVEPCPKCHADAWRLIGRGPRPETAELRCVHCGTNLVIPKEETNGGQGQ